jgi:hypothetical protein
LARDLCFGDFQAAPLRDRTNLENEAFYLASVADQLNPELRRPNGLFVDGAGWSRHAELKIGDRWSLLVDTCLSFGGATRP